MLSDEILKLRQELEKSIKDEQDYKIIYNLSVQLDNAITEYYNKSLSKSKLKQKKSIPKN